MKRIYFFICLLLAFCFVSSLNNADVMAQSTEDQANLDARVQRFLNSRRGTWRDLNVPYEDGKVLFDLIVKNNHKRALEIGTSTGHSAIWIAWALSKTGGKLITIEIDERRYRTALKNFEEAGLFEYIDARRADAHQLVKELEGPFDFVFSDADKGWYTRYFKDTDPKLMVGGCFTAHNVSNWFGGAREFVDYIKDQRNYRTTIDRTSRAGISISCKTSR